MHNHENSWHVRLFACHKTVDTDRPIPLTVLDACIFSLLDSPFVWCSLSRSYTHKRSAHHKKTPNLCLSLKTTISKEQISLSIRPFTMMDDWFTPVHASKGYPPCRSPPQISKKKKKHRRSESELSVDKEQAANVSPGDDTTPLKSTPPFLPLLEDDLDDYCRYDDTPESLHQWRVSLPNRFCFLRKRTTFAMDDDDGSPSLPSSSCPSDEPKLDGLSKKRLMTAIGDAVAVDANDDTMTTELGTLCAASLVTKASPWSPPIDTMEHDANKTHSVAASLSAVDFSSTFLFQPIKRQRLMER